MKLSVESLLFDPNRCTPVRVGNKNCVLLEAARGENGNVNAERRRLFVFVDLIINWKMRESEREEDE